MLMQTAAARLCVAASSALLVSVLVCGKPSNVMGSAEAHQQLTPAVQLIARARTQILRAGRFRAEDHTVDVVRAASRIEERNTEDGTAEIGLKPVQRHEVITYVSRRGRAITRLHTETIAV